MPCFATTPHLYTQLHIDNKEGSYIKYILDINHDRIPPHLTVR